MPAAQSSKDVKWVSETRPGSCQSGRSARIASYSRAAMSRLMVTTMALPSIAARRFSQWLTMKSAMRSNRSGAPTTASRGTRTLSAATSPRPDAAAAASTAFSASSAPAWSTVSLTIRDS